MKTLICDWCKKEFQRWPSSLRSIQQCYFCSRSCYDAWRRVYGVPSARTRQLVQCTQCNKSVLRIPARLHTSTKHFCDMKCRDAWMSEHWRGSNNPNAGEFFEILCTQCSKELVRPKWHKEKTKDHFCSIECYAKWQSVNRSGPQSPSWLGGRSFEPYPPEFTQTLRKSIRERDNYTCQDCGAHQDQLSRKLSVHHIDGGKDNSDPSNLISLCQSCHGTRHFSNDDIGHINTRLSGTP